MLNARSIIILIAGCVMFGSCVSNKLLTEQSMYFKNLTDSLLKAEDVGYEPIFQKGDILSITVITPNEQSFRLFNQPGTSGGPLSEAASGAIGPAQGGYLINENGDITFPYLGLIKAAGKSRMALTDTIQGKLQLYIDSAIVSIRLLNYKVTVLGEVTRPGTFSIPSERVTILDAIGLAGDLTIYGKRNNVRIIRSANGHRETTLLNLNDGNIFNSPFFYLRQNDIVYVELNARKIPNTDQASLKNVSIGLGIISALGVIISTINVLK